MALAMQECPNKRYNKLKRGFSSSEDASETEMCKSLPCWQGYIHLTVTEQPIVPFYFKSISCSPISHVSLDQLDRYFNCFNRTYFSFLPWAPEDFTGKRDAFWHILNVGKEITFLLEQENQTPASSRMKPKGSIHSLYSHVDSWFVREPSCSGE